LINDNGKQKIPFKPPKKKKKVIVVGKFFFFHLLFPFSPKVFVMLKDIGSTKIKSMLLVLVDMIEVSLHWG